MYLCSDNRDWECGQKPYPTDLLLLFHVSLVVADTHFVKVAEQI
jgi:hypothetical protein